MAGWLKEFSFPGPRTDCWQLPIIPATKRSKGLTMSGYRMHIYIPTQTHTSHNYN